MLDGQNWQLFLVFRINSINRRISNLIFFLENLKCIDCELNRFLHIFEKNLNGQVEIHVSVTGVLSKQS